MMASRTQSALVVGTGTVGLAAAIALRRALPAATVQLVQLPADPQGWIDRLGAASPTIHEFHRQIGLSPRQFVQRAGAEPVHLRRNRRADGTVTSEASTPAIPFVEGVPLHQVWLRHARGGSGNHPDFAALLLALREARGDEGGLGARYDSAAYATLLQQMADDVGVVRHETSGIGVETDGSAITGLTTRDGRRLTAELYVDTAGPESRLLAALGSRWQHPTDGFPAIRLTVEQASGGVPGEEWLAWSDGAITWRTRRWQAVISADAAASRAGRIRQTVLSNAVALGEAAISLPFTDGMGLGMALQDIMRLVGLLPRPGGGGLDGAEYDRRTSIAYDALIDWSQFSLRPGDPRRSPTLDALLEEFASRGRVAPRELDPVGAGQWLGRLMALGPIPRRIDPTALALPEGTVLSTIARAIRSQPAQKAKN